MPVVCAVPVGAVTARSRLYDGVPRGAAAKAAARCATTGRFTSCTPSPRLRVVRSFEPGHLLGLSDPGVRCPWGPSQRRSARTAARAASAYKRS